MTAYLWWGLAVGTISALIWLVAYATKAGRNAQSVTETKQDTDIAASTADIVQRMAKAQADGPQSKEQLLDRLDAGTG